ncbi:amidase [Roseibium suaedae]|uniref:Asp-tRNAAsn/Glu-tRNAGln amidotransferase A subunit n=1 Tax=Roseibium suaedae TaxID=735517 RepID=A0A1M7BX11_9HYPH|nr:amidase [Roseibium suaedae]SHL59542.1 Asp-tRNAAsn/Glu-tRNAGln amidotransferase A subunit [Roseibium suaedae]
MTETDKKPRSALETRKAIAEGKLTAVAATEELLDRVAALEPDVEAWVHINTKGALDAAAQLDRSTDKAPLHGVAFGVKDLFAVKDLPWRCGSPIWKDRTASFDAPVIALLRQAGGIVLGKTETTEFAGYKPSRTRNPAAPGRTPGGSSSGSAAAVACGMVPLAFGTQTSGSIIRPASFCGVVGFKPSFDTLETSGIAPLSRSLDTVGLFARDVPDIAFAMEALTGTSLQPGDASTPPVPLGVFRSAAWPYAEPALVTAWESFEERLASLQGPVPSPLPDDFTAALDPVLDLHVRLMALEAAEALAHESAIAPELLSEGLAQQLADGRATSAGQRREDRQHLNRLRAMAFNSLAPDAVWLTPSSCGPAPAFEAGTGNPAFNRTWSLLGLPCCSVPILSDAEGRPMGVQVVGAMGNDQGVLAAAHWLMQAFA